MSVYVSSDLSILHSFHLSWPVKQSYCNTDHWCHSSDYMFSKPSESAGETSIISEMAY